MLEKFMVGYRRYKGSLKPRSSMSGANALSFEKSIMGRPVIQATILVVRWHIGYSIHISRH